MDTFLFLSYHSLRPKILVIKMIKVDVSRIRLKTSTFIHFDKVFPDGGSTIPSGSDLRSSSRVGFLCCMRFFVVVAATNFTRWLAHKYHGATSDCCFRWHIPLVVRFWWKEWKEVWPLYFGRFTFIQDLPSTPTLPPASLTQVVIGSHSSLV